MTERKNSQGLAVLGMHRSGTSTLAGTMRANGVYFGDVLHKGSPRNAKGFHEPRALLYMHEDLLRKNDGAWHDPPTTITWDPLHKAVRDLFIESRRDQSLWAFKDPRTLLVLEGWLEVLPNLSFVGTFRHPAEVVASIQDRNDFSPAKGFDIWCAYNQILLDKLNEAQFPLVEFVNTPDMPLRFAALFEKLGLKLTSEAASFFDPKLKNFIKPDIPVPPQAQRIYEALQEHAL